MKKRYFLIMCSLMAISVAIGQTAIQDQKVLSGLENMPLESIYVHHNTSLLFSGEHLQYKVYCLNDRTRKSSELSKMSYVALLDRQGAPVFTHKIRLLSGVGQGDFFVPTEVPTGSYKLIGYTAWMKNSTPENFFQADIQIINPYQPISEAYLPEPADSLGQVRGSLPEMTRKKGIERGANDFFELTLDQETLNNRSEGRLEITAKTESARSGNYSLSIRKLDSFGIAERGNAEAFFADFLKKVNLRPKIDQNAFLPELRGEIITGTVANKEGGGPSENQRVALSLPGKDYLFQVARTDSKGRFYFTIDEAYDNERAILQLLGDAWDSHEITMDESNKAFSGLSYKDFTIDRDLKNAIVQRSVQNQIENAFVSVKADSLVPAKHRAPFYRNLRTVYRLDDYTRFNSLQETIIEIVDQVSIKKLNNGDRVFQVRPEEGFADTGQLPLVFVDGLFLKRHEDFMGYSAKKVKSIRFSRDKYLMGSEMFQGILFFETIADDFIDTFYAPYLKGIDLFRPQASKDYFVQSYEEGSKLERIPDFRNQLLWMPEVEVSGEETTIGFYTSDLTGDFEIVFEGFTEEGRPVSLRKTFAVD